MKTFNMVLKYYIVLQWHSMEETKENKLVECPYYLTLISKTAQASFHQYVPLKNIFFFMYFNYKELKKVF